MRRRFALATIFVCLVTPLLHAQTCPAPAVTVPAEVCASFDANASVAPPGAGQSWSSIQWDITGGVFHLDVYPYTSTTATTDAVRFAADGSGSVTLTVHVVDVLGCPSQSSATVPLRTITAPAITAPLELCPYGSGDVSVAPPPGGGAWQNVSWDVTNGYFQSDQYPYQSQWASGPTAHVFSNGQGPTSVHVNVTDDQACWSDATATIGVRTIAAPVITAPVELCPYGSGDVSVAPPPGGGAWQYVSWDVTNGYFQSDQYPYQSQWANGPNVRVFSNGQGPTTVHVNVTDNQACWKDATATIGVRTIAPPVITAPLELCPYSSGDVSVAPPPGGGAWQYVSWDVTNGYFQSDQYPYQSQWASGPTARVFSNGQGPTTVHVNVTDNQSCWKDATATIGVRTIAPPAINAPASVCAGGNASASVAGTWNYVNWNIANGHFNTDTYPYTSQYAYTPSVVFVADGSGPVTLSAYVSDNEYCQASSSATVAITNPVPQISVGTLPIPVGSPDTAHVAGSYTTIQWTIVNGSILSGVYTDTVTFQADGTGPVTLGVTASDGTGCTGTNQAQYTIAGQPAAINAPASFCSTSVTKTASVFSNGTVTNIQWSIANGTITGGANATTVSFIPSSLADVTLTLNALVDGAPASATKVVPYLVPAIQAVTNYDVACRYRYTTVQITNPEELASVSIGVQGGTLNEVDAPYLMKFLADSDTVPMTVTLQGTTNDGCPTTWTKTFGLPQSAQVSFSTPSICQGASQTATMTNASSFSSWSWSITNGAFDTQIPPFNQPASVSYHATGTAPVILNLFVYNGNDGCGIGKNYTIPVANDPAPSIATSGALCPNGSVVLTASAGQSYLWSNGGTTQAISVSAPGTYSVQVMYASGCAKQASTTVNAVTVPTPTITANGPTTFCAGGSVTLTASSGASYLWSNGATTQSIAVNASGNYSVTVTDANGCSAASAATTVTVNPLPVATITANGPTTFCAGGSVTLTASSGTSYLWSNGATTQSIAVNASGNYSVTVTNANGCSAASSATTVTVNTLPVATITANGPTTFCAGGSVMLTASSGASYVWSNGATTQSIAVNASGNYSVTVTNANGCSATSSATTVTANSLPAATITANGPTTFCAGGSVTLTANSGASYLWSNGATTQSIAVNASGNYSVTVTDANGCSATSSATTVTANPLPVATITADGPTTFCANASVGFTASAGASYLWSTGATTRSTRVYTTGDYTVTVTDANGCSATSAPVHVTALPLPVPTVSGIPAAICQGATGHASVAETFASYAWSSYNATIVGPANGQSVDFVAGTPQSCAIFLTVTGANGCSWTYSYNMAVNGVPNPDLLADATDCLNGTHVANVWQPAGGSTFAWSVTNGTVVSVEDYQGNPTPNGPVLRYSALAAGPLVISVTETNTSGCTKTVSHTVNVTQPTPMDFTVASVCPGATGVAHSVNNYSNYSWTIQNGTILSGGNSHDVTFSASSDPANPTVLTLDSPLSGACVSPVTKTVPMNTLPAATITANGPTTFCAGGSVTLTASSGASYHWSTGSTTQSISVTFGGNYSVIVTNASGCSTTSSPTTVTVNPLPVATITAGGPTTFCAGGSVTLTASSAASYLWSNGATTQSIAVNASGSYSVTVTDANGCSATSSSTTVTVNPLPVATITAGGPTTFCVGGSVTLTASSGASYLWSNGATTQSIAVNASGNYSVTVTNANGCSAASSATTVTVNPLPVATITAGGPTTFCAGGSVTLTASSAASYLWSNGATTSSITVNASGNYSVTVTDANGCSATSAATSVTVNPLPVATITANGPTSFCAGGSVTLTASSGTSYLWSNGATTQSIAVNASGNYSVTVTNANGCSAASSGTTVTVNPLPVATITANGPTTFCAGGSVTLTASSGASYLWSNGATTQSIAVNASGNYSVTVTNANGCSAASSGTTVTVNPLPVATITAGGPTTFCAGGSVTLTASSGASYLWSNGATTPSISVNASGNYSVTVTDANGCSATSSATSVTVNPLPVATITANGPTTFCAGGNVTLTASSGASYLWSSGATTQSIVVSAAGSYHVAVTNANGCTATSADTVVATNSGPTPAITAPSAICNGASGNASTAAVSGATYSWTIGNGTITGGAGTNAITFTSTSGPVSLGVTVTDANGCSGSASTSVTVNALPNATITAPAAICSGTSGAASVASVSGGTYVWTITGGTITGGSGTNAITFTSTTGPISLGVTVTNASSCSATGNKSVTVNALPNATITAPAAICSGTSGAASVASVSGGTYVWTITGGTITGGSGTNAITFTSTSGPVSLGVTVTNASSCSATGNKSVTVNANPATPTITAGGPTTFCIGGSVTLTAPAASSYHWSTGATTQSIVVTTTGSYTVSVTNASGCTSALSAPTTVTVNPATAITQQPANASIPKNTTTTLSVTATGTGTLNYQWYNPPTANNNDTSRPVGTNSPTFTTPKLSHGTYYYYVVVTGTCGTVRSSIATVTSN